MDDYKEEAKAVDEALDKMVKEKSTEAIENFQEKLETFGEKFDAVSKTEVAACFCGEPIDDPTEQEVSPSMYYFNRRTCSTICHNKWILGQFDDGGRPVDKGWWGIIDQLDRDITELDPDYSIMQVKEKFGTLRYYADFDEPELPNGITSEEVRSIGRTVSYLYGELQKIDDPEGWFGKDVEFEPIPDWKEKQIREDYANLRALRGKLQPIQKLIDVAEALSAKTCEWCGSEGSMDNTGGWVLTLCDGCKTKRVEGKRPWDEVENE